jgi:hypothetical protein
MGKEEVCKILRTMRRNTPIIVSYNNREGKTIERILYLEGFDGDKPLLHLADSGDYLNLEYLKEGYDSIISFAYPLDEFDGMC